MPMPIMPTLQEDPHTADKVQEPTWGMANDTYTNDDGQGNGQKTTVAGTQPHMEELIACPLPITQNNRPGSPSKQPHVATVQLT